MSKKIKSPSNTANTAYTSQDPEHIIVDNFSIDKQMLFASPDCLNYMCI